MLPADVSSAIPKKIGNMMNRSIPTCGFIPLLFLNWLLFTAIGSGQAASRISSAFLARGERSLLEVTIAGAKPDAFPIIEPVPGVTIQSRSGVNGSQFETIFGYEVMSYEVGKHTIPAITVITSGIERKTEPLEIEVFDPDELQWAEETINGETIRYATAFKTMKLNPYEGETTYTEIKVYYPRSLEVEDWGIPEFKIEGLTAWRFQPSTIKSSINLLGSPYVSVAYPSTLTPTRSGGCSIGPAKVRLTTIQVYQDPLPKRAYEYVFLDVPQLKLEARPLPEGAPDGFENAIGNFRITANTATTEVKEGEPLSVDLQVTGSGNLDTIRPPRMTDEAGWKVYEATSDQRGDERRQLAGSAVFHQFMRPLELKPAIPSFKLVYFDPKEEVYKTTTTDPISLRMIPSPAAPAGMAAAAAVQSLPIPIERMTDILTIINPAQLTLPASSTFLPILGHFLAGIAALTLIFKAFWMRYAPRFAHEPMRVKRLNALREVENLHSASDIEFLKASGAFVESHFGSSTKPELLAILAERDAICFRNEKTTLALDPQRRKSILHTLRQAATALLMFFLLGNSSPPLRAADIATQAREAYDAAKYDDAIKLWLGAGDYNSLTADTLYNIGNASYRSGSPGIAALFYRRALARDVGHEESRQNLRFIERKYGSISVQRPEYQFTLTKFPISTWKSILWTGLWLCLLATLVFPATRRGAPLRFAAMVVLVIAPFIVSVGLLGWGFFPNDSEFAPVSRQAVIIVDGAVLHADAARTSPEVIDAPPGSLCEVIRVTGDWAYVAFTNKTRGWLPIESIEKIVPEKSPTPPKFRKPKADAKTA